MKFQKFIASFDLHGDRQDPETVKAFFKFDAMWKPDLRIFGGDLIDLRGLRKGASEDEKRESMRSDIEAGQRFLKDWKPHWWLRGNHCERLWELARWGTGLQQDYALKGVQDFESICQRTKTKMLPYHKRDGVLRVGHLKVIHGFACGVYAARQTALVYGSTLFGHVHTIDEHSIAGLERRVARACGCLCSTDMDYSSRQPNTLRQANGWAYGVINKESGFYTVWQAERIEGTWLLPSDVKAI